MAITRSEVRRIAALARLEVPEGDLERLTAELSQVLDFVETLRALDLAAVEPVTFAPADAPLRDDIPDERRLGAAAATAMAPASSEGCFLVPPVVEPLEP